MLEMKTEPGQDNSKPKSPPLRRESGEKCNWRGYEKHERKLCPARSVICNTCKKNRHFQVVCHSKSKPVHEVKSMGEFGRWMGKVVIPG